MSLPDPNRRMPSWLDEAWLARYLARGLDADEQAWFEAYVIDKPALVDALERDSDLRDGVVLAAPTDVAASPGSRDAGASASPSAPVATAASVAGRATRRKPIGALPRPLAWAAALMVSGTLGLFAGQWLPRAGDAPAPIGSPTRIVFDTQRGASSAPTVEIGDATSPWVLVEVALPPDATDLVFIDADGRRTPLRPGNDGFASVLVPRAQVRAGSEARVEFRHRDAVASRALPLHTQ